MKPASKKKKVRREASAIRKEERERKNEIKLLEPRGFPPLAGHPAPHPAGPAG